MSTQWDGTPREGVDGTNIVKTLGAASLGGTTGVRIIIDDTVVTSKSSALRDLELIAERIVGDTWPPR